jgi:hypothetical protein
MGVQWTSWSAIRRLQENMSVRREALYSILIEFGVPMKLVMLIKMCLIETYREVRVGKHSSKSFPAQNGHRL